MYKRFIYSILSIFILLSVRVDGTSFSENNSYSARSQFGAVSCGHPLAAQAALTILKSGGNAIDAAVACAFMLGVVDFSNFGLGGDGFALICLPNGQVLGFDGSVQRPEALKSVAKKNIKDSSQIGLPTATEMLLKMLRLYGSKWPSEVLSPAVLICIKGFKISSYLEKVIEQKLLLIKDKVTIEFLAPKGYPLRAGSILKQPKLAKTLLQIGRDGGRSFYSGEQARIISEDMKSKGSLYTFGDFLKYKSKYVRPIRKKYKDLTIYGTPAPSSSIVSISMALTLLEKQVKLFPETPKEILENAVIGRQAVNSKYNYLSKSIDNPALFNNFYSHTTSNTAVKPSKIFADTNTTHVSVVDRNGMAVSMTLTLGNHFGTGELSPCGFFYNNGMRNFMVGSVYPEDYPSNAGPVSSKSPVIVTKDQKFYIALGGAGADRIITNTGLILARLLSGHSLSKSVSAPRFFLDHKNNLHLEWQPNIDLTKKLVNEIKEPYKLNLKPGCDDYFGLISGIIADQSGYYNTVADQRRDGACGVIKD